MIYPMAQSVAHFCIEIDKKMALSIVIIITIMQNHFRAYTYQNRNENAKLSRAQMRESMSHQ
jgi:hypothetical protein